MWLFDVGPAAEWEQKGQTIASIFDQIQKGLNALSKPETTLRGLTSIEDEARKLQKTMSGGMVLESGKFREQLMLSYEGVLKMGGTFQSITDAVAGMAEGMNKVTFLTTDIVKTGEVIKKANGDMEEITYTAAESMVALAKGTNMAEKEVGTMVSNFIRLEGSQTKSLEKMQEISKTARMSGIMSKKLLEEVQTNLKNIDSYGFKNGVDGLAKMATQAQILRTSVDEIGALSVAQGLWDPEKAIETATNLQMLGGSIGGLGDPFKLMNMGMNDVEELQNQMVDMAANAFKINEKTGEIDISNTSRMRLKAQAEAMGSTLEEMTKIGREAFKAKQVMESAAQTGFGEGMPKETKDLLASISEFKGGKMTLDIPGFKTDDLEKSMRESPALLKEKLAEYQKVADMSDREIAEKGMTLQESLNRDTRMIRDALILRMDKTQRQDIIDAFDSGIDKMAGKTSAAVLQQSDIVAGQLTNLSTDFEAKSKTKILTPDEKLNKEQELQNQRDAEKIKTLQSPGATPTTNAQNANINAQNATINMNNNNTQQNDAAFSTGSKTLSLGKGEMFNFIKEDEAVFAPNLLKNLDILKNSYMSSLRLKDTLEQMSNIKSRESSTGGNAGSTQKIEASGDINININVNTSGTLSDALMKDRTFTQELKDRVMTIIKDKSKIAIEKGQVK